MTRSAAARIAAHTSWAGTRDRAARTAPARTGLLDRFQREARDRLGSDATEREIAAAAESARSAFYARLSAAGVKARTTRT